MREKSLKTLDTAAFHPAGEKGTVLLLTLMMLVLLTFEVATISLVAQRGLGEEGMLASQNISARRGAEVALNRLEEKLYNDLRTKTAAAVEATYDFGDVDAIAETDLMVTNPSSGASEATDVKISAWLKERRGYWYHLMGRAKTGTVDLIAHRWVKISPCQIAGTLTTIVSGVKNPGANRGILVDSTGRVFFGQDALASDNGGGTYWTWSKTTGLSTLFTNADQPVSMISWELGYGWQRHVIDTTTDRVFFTNRDLWKVWSWHSSTGLSTLADDAGDTLKIASSGRIYWGCMWGGSFSSWKSSTGLSTLVPDTDNTGGTGMCPINGPVSDSRVFTTWGNDGKVLYRWDASTGLSTIVTSAQTAGIANDLSSINGNNTSMTDVFVAEDWNDTSGTVLRWNATTGLSTIMSEECYGCGDYQTLPDGTMWFGGYNPQYLWSAANGLSTLTYDTNDYDLDPALQQAAYSYGTQMLWWDRSGGGIGTFTTMHSTGFNMGYDGALSFDRTSKRAFFGSDHTSNSRFYTWHSSTGLSTIVGNTSGKNKAGAWSTMVDVMNRNMVYFGDDQTAGSLNVWSPSYGLSTIVSGRRFPGQAMERHPEGGVYFGENGNAVNFYFWEPPASCDNLGY